MAWHVAPALEKLLAQINALAPNRSKVSDGSIGDAAHAASVSDHNPENGEVDARDFTHDPARGADMNKIAEALRLSRDRRIRYVIWNRRYFSPRTGWKWAAYSGDNPHDKHMHVSVNDVADYDMTPWTIAQGQQEEEDVAQPIVFVRLIGGDGTVFVSNMVTRAKVPSMTALSGAQWQVTNRGLGDGALLNVDNLDAFGVDVTPRPVGTVVLTEQDKNDLIAGLGIAAESAVRKVLGAVDGATPPAA